MTSVGILLACPGCDGHVRPGEAHYHLDREQRWPDGRLHPEGTPVHAEHCPDVAATPQPRPGCPACVPPTPRPLRRARPRTP